MKPRNINGSDGRETRQFNVVLTAVESDEQLHRRKDTLVGTNIRERGEKLAVVRKFYSISQFWIPNERALKLSQGPNAIIKLTFIGNTSLGTV